MCGSMKPCICDIIVNDCPPFLTQSVYGVLLSTGSGGGAFVCA